ncbi:hypothetical protein vseg_005527 [Gypsophila vaccaria]
MVFVKRMLNNGVIGYRSSAVPRAPRSMRKRSLREKKVEGAQLCAFELLATVAGKLLEESECSSSSSSVAVGFDKCDIGKDGVKEPVTVVHDDQGSSEGSVHVSPLASSACSEKVHSDSELASQKNHAEFVKLSSKIMRDFPLSGEFDDTILGNVVNTKLGVIEGALRDNKPPVPNGSEEIVELPLCRDSVSPNHSFLKHVNDVKIDEILFRCSQPNIARKTSRPPTRGGDRRFRKLLTSKYWKTAPKLEDCENTNAGRAVKHNKRPCYEIDRSRCDTPIKKRKLFDRSSVVTNDGGISCESVSNSPEKSRDDSDNTIAGNEKLSSAFTSQNSCNSGNAHVRLSIKSFRVPELFVEVPEDTTVDSLKRTVLEAVTSILGGGLRVGVILHGKKIRDDNRTLLQAGISQNDDMDVGFMLEPNSPTQPSAALCLKEPSATLLSDSPKFANRSQLNLQKDIFLIDSADKPDVTDSKSPTQSSRDLVPSATVELPEKNAADSNALALAVLPVDQRPKRSELGQRRTRRPFSVSEVEALVHAVEKLGTGRWRDIKICSFDNAVHRTYVDLKDKWKTLVHTASIAPQQRRGEPVPQVLLDRVLAAQAYWSEHQPKPLDKLQPQQDSIVPKLTDSIA